jgi:hypothetical protein
MAPVLHHALLGIAIAALAGAGLRIASPAAPRGAERAVAAAVIAASIAALEALGLGLVRLGTSPAALAIAAGATWLAARALLPAPAQPAGAELARAWQATPLAGRLVLGAAAGALIAWAAWLLRHPALGIDTVAYHLTEVVAWIGNGSPGAVEPIFPAIPVGNYPLTNEVLMAWATGIARSFVVVGIWAPAAMALLAVAGWAGLRALRVQALAAGLAVGALCLTPVATHYQQNGAATDLPALTWLVCAAFLALASARRPALIAPAILAVGLAVGTKTTTAPLALLVLALALIAIRRRVSWPLVAGATAAATLIGGYWYLRNLVDHGSPLWPFVTTPWGDPMPYEIGPERGVNASFLDRPRETLERVGEDWLDLFAGGFGLLAAAVVAPLLARERRVTIAAAATVVAFLLWTNAPFTGASVPEYDVATASIVRYLMPALAAAIVTLALTAASPRRLARGYGIAALGAGLAVNAVQTADLGYPSVPRVWVPLAGAALGAGAALALTVAAARLPAPALPAAARIGAVAAAAALVGVAVTPAASGFVERHAATAQLYGTDTIRWFTTQPRFGSGDDRIWAAPVNLAPLAGDRLQHEFGWIALDEPCGRVREIAREGWTLVFIWPQTGRPMARNANCLRSEPPAHRGSGFLVYGG